jgi:hypothetical protein
MILLLSLLSTLICGYRIVAMFFLTTDFVVEKSYQVCEQPLNNRCETHFSIRLPEGSARDFVPFGTEFERDDLHEGAHIAKQSFGFDYGVSGLPMRWPSLMQQVLLFLAGLVGFVVWWTLHGPEYLRFWAAGIFRGIWPWV